MDAILILLQWMDETWNKKCTSMYARVSRNLKIKLGLRIKQGEQQKNLHQYKSFVHERVEQSIWPSCTPWLPNHIHPY